MYFSLKHALNFTSLFLFTMCVVTERQHDINNAEIFASHIAFFDFYFFSEFGSPYFNIKRKTFSFPLVCKITFFSLQLQEDSMLSINNILKYKFCMDCSCGIKENLPFKKLASVLAIVAASSEKVRYYPALSPVLSGFVNNQEMFKRQVDQPKIQLSGSFRVNMNKLGHSKNKVQAVSTHLCSFPEKNFIPAKSLDILQYFLLIHSNIKNLNAHFCCLTTFSLVKLPLLSLLCFQN